MGLAITSDHQQLADAARGFLTSARAEARATLAGGEERLPDFWKQLGAMGWLGLAVPESDGGEGFGLPELAIVVEALGHEVAPGPFAPTALAAALVSRFAAAEVKRSWLPGLLDGSVCAGVGWTDLPGGVPTLTGAAGPVLGGGTAELLVLPLGDDVALVARDTTGITVVASDDLDTTRRSPQVVLDAVVPVAVLPGARPVLRRLSRTLLAAEAAGVARASTEAAVAYAKVREQFGRTIGTFQAVKHHCARMLVQSELATAAAWNAARSDHDLEAAAAAVVSRQAAEFCSRMSIQVHGGIGFTWEHDAHLYLRRATVLSALLGADGDVAADVVALDAAGTRAGVELPPEADDFRAAARALVAELDAAEPAARRALLAESGYLMPHWPAPWGRAAGPLEQLVIEEELVGVERPNLGIGGWVLLTIVQHATPDQLERWIRPGLHGELRFCQLFSEPNAGSDAAAIATRATRVEGGWRLNGQKVWISTAKQCDRGLITVRTNPDAPKHRGVSTMVIDLHAEGVDIRPLRELTGNSLFNEVFLDDVFVPDDDVVGEIDAGWTVARATLGNERVSIGGGGSSTSSSARTLVELLGPVGGRDRGDTRAVGELLAEELGMSALNLRLVERALVGAEPGAEGSVTKLLAATHTQAVDELGMRLAGPAAVTGGTPALTHAYLFGRCLTIAGGTTEILLNQVAERLLGLPRDPLLR